MTFRRTDRKLTVYSLKGLHSSQAELLSNVVGGRLKGLTLLYRMGVGRLKSTQREKNTFVACLHMQEPEVGAWQKRVHSIFTVTS